MCQWSRGVKLAGFLVFTLNIIYKKHHSEVTLVSTQEKGYWLSMVEPVVTRWLAKCSIYFQLDQFSKLLKVIMYDLMFVLMVFNTWYWTIRDQETKVSLRQILWPLLDCIRRHHNMNTDDIHQSIWSRILWSSLRLKLFKCNQSRPGAEQIIQLHKTHWPDPPWNSENYFCFLTWKIFDTLVKCYGTRPIHCVN